jgi:hypothetical protein
MSIRSKCKKPLTALLISAAFVNVSFFAAISQCCKTLDNITDWVARPPAYFVKLLPYKTENEFWVLIFVAQYIFFALVIWAGMHLGEKIIEMRAGRSR